jgi:REP element-mobilizing transposase RayT
MARPKRICPAENEKGGQDSFLQRIELLILSPMARPKRICPAGEVFHVLNRSVARLTIFEKPEDYMAFLRALDETWERVPLPIFAMVLMPNHWYFVVRPSADDQVSSFFRLLTVTHTMRWHAHYHTGGTGHLYQGKKRGQDSFLQRIELLFCRPWQGPNESARLGKFFTCLTAPWPG